MNVKNPSNLKVLRRPPTDHDQCDDDDDRMRDSHLM